MQARFARLAMQASVVAGSAWMFLGTVLAFGVWLLVGCLPGVDRRDALVANKSLDMG